ncbi:YIP1 family protein [Streptomyces scopuliridis]|uniref:YIP1 family protein n=1 Tax=Streptomyces scopuliridis TaxID=452529 RepID=A0ACD4ZK88_9ACTN|nr:Yip1 family protein [Streptomyces scopuliridis]WSB34537.1 YIP1 family protein [Streptomyces scopuliridis]WSB98783.1 YIP1 family protein [Streptomyces scopuliridis]WSC07514.1 YIP1 family protein [Streptomyces scopuliridis]
MAGFRIGRGRDNRTPQQQPQRQQQQPYGRQAPPPPGYGGGHQAAPPYGQQQWPPAGGAPNGYGGGGHGGGHGEPEYFGDPYGQQGPHGHPPQGGRSRHGGHGGQPGDPYANNPGHTQAFSVNEDPYDAGTAYRAGAAAAPAGPRLHWKELLSGVVLRPSQTFLRMRDYPVWGPALVVTFVYGLLALFGFDTAREDAINATLSTAIPYVLTTGIAFVFGGLILGAVTHTLARQLGGDGAWQPTVGLSMLIMSITDAPRLVFALFLGGENSLVQVLGWITWIAAGALFTVMVSKSHDLPWPKALGASAIQLIALLALLKLGTL